MTSAVSDWIVRLRPELRGQFRKLAPAGFALLFTSINPMFAPRLGFRGGTSLDSFVLGKVRHFGGGLAVAI